MATGSGPQRISPRKFSEKIALLNKKEAEGNAEFEKIIKEAQATRSQSACGSYTRQVDCSSAMFGLEATDTFGLSDLTSEQREELEEVYQDLVENVKRPDSSSCQQSTMNFDAEISFDPASRSISNSNQQRISAINTPNSNNNNNNNGNLPLNLSPCVNILQSNNNSDLNFVPYVPVAQQNPSKQDQQQHSSDCLVSSEYPYYAQELVAATTTGTAATTTTTIGHLSTCRARGTSIGSTNHKHIYANAALQPRTYHHHPYYSQNHDHNGQNQFQENSDWLMAANSGAEMYLKPAYDRSWQKSSSDPTLHAPCNYAEGATTTNQDNATCADNLPVDQIMHMDCQQQSGKVSQSLTGSDVEHQENVGPMGGMYEYDSSAYQLTTKQEPCFNAQQSQDQSIITEAQLGGGNNSDMNARGDLPGIKICAIDDDSMHQQQQFETSSVVASDQEASSRESSLPDLTNLQFGGVYDKSPVSYGEETSFLNRSQILSRPQCDHQPADSGPVRWPALGAVPESLYEPVKVNNLLSNSDCGLSHHQTHLNTTSDLSEVNLIRSHSHSSIDFLTKQRTRHLPVSCQANHQTGHLYGPHQPASPYSTPQYSNLQLQQQGVKYDSVSSMRPQLGSMSPLADSSSNLTSPQSEQNSPCSSSTDYAADPLGVQQQQQTSCLAASLIMSPETIGETSAYLVNRSYQSFDHAIYDGSTGPLLPSHHPVQASSTGAYTQQSAQFHHHQHSNTQLDTQFQQPAKGPFQTAQGRMLSQASLSSYLRTQHPHRQHGPALAPAVPLSTASVSPGTSTPSRGSAGRN